MVARCPALVLIALAGCAFDTPTEPISDVEVSWEMSIAGEHCECADVGATVVRVSFVAPAEHRFADWFPCTDRNEIARYLPVDDYTVTATAIADGGIELEHAEAVAIEMSPDEQMTVPEFHFDFGEH